MLPLTPCQKVPVRVVQSDETYQCSLEESLLKGMLKLGRKGIPVGCVSGGCGVCKVKIIEGSVRALGPVSRAHVSQEEEAQGYTLACRVAPVEAVVLEVSPLLRKPFCRPPCPPAADSAAGGSPGNGGAVPTSATSPASTTSATSSTSSIAHGNGPAPTLVASVFEPQDRAALALS
ncbi:Ferredoxin [Kerstersia similis]